MSDPKSAPWAPVSAAIAALLLWVLAARITPSFALPAPEAVAAALVAETRNGRLLADVAASLGRVGRGSPWRARWASPPASGSAIRPSPAPRSSQP